MMVPINDEMSPLGYEPRKEFDGVNVVVPLREYCSGMKVRIDGRTFVGYRQLESGITIPGHVIKDSGLPYREFRARDGMILNS